MDKGENMRDLLRSLLPDYWLMNYQYSAVWDAKFRRLMSKHKFEYESMYVARLGEMTIWVENHPYASFTPQHPQQMSVRPSRRTIAYARRKLLADLMGSI